MRVAILAASVLLVPTLAAADQLCTLPPGPPPARPVAALASAATPASSSPLPAPPPPAAAPRSLLRTPGTAESMPTLAETTNAGHPAAASVQGARPPAVAAAYPPTQAASDSVPALRHIRQAGATLTGVETSHGLRTFVARQNDDVLVVQLAPDGEAVVTGLMSDLSVAQLKAAYAGLVTDLAPLHGLAGFLVRSGSSFQVFYATPDSERLIPGNMWDASGRNLTRDQVASIEGAIPTVSIIGPSSAGNAAAAPGIAGQLRSEIDALKRTTYGVAGVDAAPRLWMLVDPLCPISVRGLRGLQSYIDSKRIQLAVVPLSILDHENQGRSTLAASAMVTLPRDSMIEAWAEYTLPGMSNSSVSAPSSDPAAAGKLAANMAVAASLGLRGTPTFLWRNADGTEGRFDGLPSNIGLLVAQVAR